jgi:hypothetical protein
MMLRLLGVGAAALVAATSPAAADPGDRAEKQWQKRAECDRKLHEAKSRRDFRQKAAECNWELAKLDREQRREAAKEWREAEKKWRERNRYHDGGYYDWDD